MRVTRAMISVAYELRNYFLATDSSHERRHQPTRVFSDRFGLRPCETSNASEILMYEAMVAMFGYGQLTARMWLVGLEEHCGDETNINERIGIRTAQPALMCDVEDFHQQLTQGMPAIERVSVWSIGLQLYVQTYGQPTFIGRLAPHQSDLLLAEILPLPRPQHSHWPAVYQQAFATAQEYVQAALPQMSQRLCELATAHRPKAVVLHGKGKHDRWIKGHPVMGNGWTLFRYGERANETLKWKLQDEVLWLRTNNLVNNGHIT